MGDDYLYRDYDDELAHLQNENERLRQQNAELVRALQNIADGKYSGYVLTSMPPQDPAVVYAKAVIIKATGSE